MVIIRNYREDNEKRSVLERYVLYRHDTDPLQHGISSSSKFIFLYCILHGQSMIEGNVHQLLQGHELCRRRQDAILTKVVAYKESIILYQPLCTHVFER